MFLLGNFAYGFLVNSLLVGGCVDSVGGDKFRYGTSDLFGTDMMFGIGRVAHHIWFVVVFVCCVVWRRINVTACHIYSVLVGRISNR